LAKNQRYKANQKDVFEAIVGRLLIMSPEELEHEFGERRG